MDNIIFSLLVSFVCNVIVTAHFHRRFLGNRFWGLIRSFIL